VPFVGHSLIFTALRRGRALLIGKNERGALELELAERRIARSFASSQQRAFYGHGAYSDDGRTLFTAELDQQTGIGALVIRDAESFKILGELPSHGSSPHECRLIDGGKVMLVANAGRQPDYNGSSMTYVELASGKLLRKLDIPAPQFHMTHFAVAADGALVVSSAPNHGRPQAAGAIFAARPHGELVQVDIPATIQSRLHDETLSVAICDERQLAAITVPAGNAVLFVSTHSLAHVGSVTLDRPAGVVLSPDRRHFIVAGRQSLHWVDVATLGEDATRAAPGMGCLSHALLANA
jgi:hypothetical protein